MWIVKQLTKLFFITGYLLLCNIRAGYDSLLPGITGIVCIFLQRVAGAEELAKEYVFAFSQTRHLNLNGFCFCFCFCLFVYLFICLFVYLFICLFVYLFICLFVYYRFGVKLIQGAEKLGVSSEYKELFKKLPSSILTAERHCRFYAVSYQH